MNDPRIIAQEPDFVSINATTEVDFIGQAASETIAGRYWSGSGGQADFARARCTPPGGQGFIVLRSTAAGGTVSRIVPRLRAGSVVTTLKNTVDKVVTEYGVAELRGKSVREHTPWSGSPTRVPRRLETEAPPWVGGETPSGPAR